MLMHHSAQDYGAAAERAADWATEKLQAIIGQGRDHLATTVQKIETTHPRDAIVAAPALGFGAGEKGFGVQVEGFEEPLGFHPHAMVQAAERIGMPSAKRMVDWVNSVPEGPTRLADLFNDHFHREQKKYLVRVVDNQVRGFLSDRYRRLNSGPIVKGLMESVAEYGAMPIKAQYMDTKFYLKFLLPHILEPIPNEVMLFGLNFRTSDFGDGKLEISGFIHRLRCTNLMMTEDGFSQVHLGGRLSDNISYSDRTYELDTQTVASATKDIVRNVFAPEYVKAKMEQIKEAHEKEVDADVVIEALRKKSRLTKEEAGEVKKLFTSADVQMLPPGQSQLRLANTLSLFAQQTEPDRELELEKLAGEVAGVHKAN